MSTTTPPDRRSLRIARRQRRTNGLEDLFAIQTTLRTEISNMQRLLQDLPTYNLTPTLAADLKQTLQHTMADTAERLHRTTTPTGD